MDLTEDTPVRLVRSPSTHDLDLTAEEEKIKIMRTKSFGSCKITISTSNLSVIDDVDYLRFRLKSSSSPIFPRIIMEEESHDASHSCSTFGLLNENTS